LRRREPDLPRPFKVPLYPITPILSVLACGFILFRLRPWSTWLWFGLWVGAALLFYVLWSRRHSALNDGGDGYIPTQVPGDDDVMMVSEPADHHFVTKHKDEP
jgi:APA family basic amino acid/polyamine antiporter